MANSENFSPPIFCKQSADNSKYLENLVCFELQRKYNNHDHHTIFVLAEQLWMANFCNTLAIWSQIYLNEDEVIAKISCNTPV